MARAVLERLGQRGLAVETPVGCPPARGAPDDRDRQGGGAGRPAADPRRAHRDPGAGRDRRALRRHRQLRDDGVAIVYISHRMDEVFRLADRVTVLRDGRVVATRPIAAVTRAAIVRQMVGRELAAGYPLPGGAPGRRIAAARCGLHRAGSRGLADAASRRDRGAGRARGRRTERSGAGGVRRGAARRRRDDVDGAAYAPRLAARRDRRRRRAASRGSQAPGAGADRAMRENVVLARSRRGSRAPASSTATRSATAVAEWIDDTRASGRRRRIRPCGSLSGGNQQKVVLARWMLAHSRLLALRRADPRHRRRRQGRDLRADAAPHR